MHPVTVARGIRPVGAWHPWKRQRTRATGQGTEIRHYRDPRGITAGYTKVDHRRQALNVPGGKGGKVRLRTGYHAVGGELAWYGPGPAPDLPPEEKSAIFWKLRMAEITPAWRYTLNTNLGY